MFALHAAATADPALTLEHVTADETTEVTSVDFWLDSVPSDRRARPRFSAVAANIKAIAANPSLRKPAPKGSRKHDPNLTTRVRHLEEAVHRELMRLGEDRCKPKSMQTMRTRYENKDE